MTNDFSTLRMHFVRGVLTTVSMILLAGCATTYDLSEKYSAYIGKQFRTRFDGYIWKMQRHEFEFYPYHLEHAQSSGLPGTRLEFIPKGSIVTIKAAKRSYAGGDWDYLISEVPGPKTGTVYTFEDLLGFSTYLPRDIEKFLEPLEKSAENSENFNSENFFNAPNGRFSIRKTAFATPPTQWAVTEPPDMGSFSFFFPQGGIVRIDYWEAPEQPLAGWMRDPKVVNVYDRALDGVVNFTRAKTSGLKELNLLTKRSSADLGGTMSCAVYRMRIQGGEHAGTYIRGFLPFSHGAGGYILHYQTADDFADDKVATEFIFGRLTALKDAMVFHDY